MFWYLGSFQFDEVFDAAPPVAIRSVGDRGDHLVYAGGRGRQIRTDPALCLAARCDGGPTPVFGVDPCRDDGDGGCVSHYAFRSALHACAAGSIYCGDGRRGDCALRRDNCSRTIRHQESFGLLHHFTAWLHGCAVGMGAYAAGMFHLITHAFFKALLFLSAGSVILGLERGHHHLAHHSPTQTHPRREEVLRKRATGLTEKAEHDEETFDPGDMRNMGGLRKTMPVTFWLYLIGTLALAGIFPLAGFWSKDEILLDASLHYHKRLLAVDHCRVLHRLSTWGVRFGWSSSVSRAHRRRARAGKPKGDDPCPLMVLAVLSVAGGALNLPV